MNEERLAEAFDRIDCDDSGYISADNLLELLGDDFPKEEIDEIIKEASTENEGKISYDEFLALWTDHNEQQREEVIKEITVLKRATDSDRSLANLSILSGEDESEDSGHGNSNIISRATFIGGKKMSERKVSGEEEGKHVAFKKAVTTIPDDCV